MEWRLMFNSTVIVIFFFRNLTVMVLMSLLVLYLKRKRKRNILDTKRVKRRKANATIQVKKTILLS